MSTLKQQQANRRNAQKSTGPKTDQGKARSRVNGIQHGLSAQLLVIPCESQAEYDAHAATMRADLAPVGAVEDLLVDRLIAGSWRLRRILRFETRFYLEETDHFRPADPNPNVEVDLAMRVFCYATRSIEKNVETLGRHEARFERSFYRALKELQNLQDRRREADLAVSELQSEPNFAEPMPIVQHPDAAPASRPAEPRVVSTFPRQPDPPTVNPDPEDNPTPMNS